MPVSRQMIIISTLVGLLQPVLSALSGALRWQGLQHWFFLLGLRLLAMYFAVSSWESAPQDVACAWSPGQEAETRTFCTSVCYNRYFLAPVLPTWGFSFLIALSHHHHENAVPHRRIPTEGAGGRGVGHMPRAAEHSIGVNPPGRPDPSGVGESNCATKSNMAATVGSLGEPRWCQTQAGWVSTT
ncbi:hypothetical protein G0U57_003180 [Chelydra serpentina]|uniref:Uncharacterized protein n=1 Tax=Chelydra serpentina TaxID=8475 RepID=A0A8T1S085_CHESE|nr:hypothetical protein G0U57_003180 [Chelydra serpentina]